MGAYRSWRRTRSAGAYNSVRDKLSQRSVSRRASEAATVLRALRCSNLQLLESCATSTTRLSEMFETAAAEGGEQGGGAGGVAGLAARMALEAAVMEAEPPPYLMPYPSISSAMRTLVPF